MKKCKASIVFGDDFGDNCTTFHCQRELGHNGPHKETGDMGYGIIPMPYTMTWEGSDEELNKVMVAKASTQSKVITKQHDWIKD
jgi:hypothetical protein